MARSDPREVPPWPAPAPLRRRGGGIRNLVVPGLLAREFATGDVAVDVFFVLSGFVLAERYRRESLASALALRWFSALSGLCRR